MKKQPPLTSNHHHGHGKDLLYVCRRGDVPEADAGQAGHGEVQGSDVNGVFVGAALPPPRAAGVEAVRGAHRLSQLVEPAVHAHSVGDLVNDLVVADAVPDV